MSTQATNQRGKPTSSSSQPLVTVGIITYNDKQYLSQVLPSLLNQTYPNIEILIYDNNPNKSIRNWINTNFPTIKVFGDFNNIGFGKAHNALIEKAKGDYYLCHNSDAFISKNYIEELLAPFKNNPKTAVTTGKLLQWTNFPYSPDKIIENTIDSLGIIPFRNNSFTEKDNAALDNGKFDAQTEIWGASATSVMCKLELIRQVEHSFGEVFDKNFFMYKEDVDLMYRIRWAGFNIIYQPTAVAWHDRTVSPTKGFFKKLSAQNNKSDYVKSNSFLNHLILVYKNWSSEFPLSIKIKTIFFILKYSLYLLIFDPKILMMYSKFRKLLPELKYKKEKMPRNITAKEMTAWFI